MAESLVTSVRVTPVSKARITSVAAEALGTASSQARVSRIAIEALLSVAEVPGVPALPQRLHRDGAARDTVPGAT